MKTVGLITEYNPFHNGHLYHIEKAKELTGADRVVVIMSTMCSVELPPFFPNIQGHIWHF